MDTERITRDRLRNHWNYSWWKYLVMGVIVVMVVEIAFSVTAYRPPADKQLTVYFCHSYVYADSVQEDLWPILHERHPEQELLTVQHIDLASQDYSGRMQFSTYLAARQGDILILPSSETLSFLSQDDPNDLSLVDLSPFIEKGIIKLGDIDVSAYTRERPEGGTGIYGIPLDSLEGLYRFGCTPTDAVVSIMFFCENQECAADLIELMLERYAEE